MGNVLAIKQQTQTRRYLADLDLAEKIADFEFRALFGIRTVNDVVLFAGRPPRANRSLCRFSRIGRAHDFTVASDYIVALEHHEDDRAGNHELDQLTEERPFFVYVVESLSLPARELFHLYRGYSDPRAFEYFNHFANEPSGDAVRLNDGQGPLHIGLSSA